MSQTIHLTATLKLSLPSHATRADFYAELPHMLRTGLGELLPEATDAVTVVAVHNSNGSHLPPYNLDSLLKPFQSMAVVWTTDDVQHIRPDLSEAQAMDVLCLSQENHGANFGINWDTLSFAAELLFGEAPAPEEVAL